MSRGFSLPQPADIDNPWRRLPWTLPTALLIWAVVLWGLAYFMEKPTYRHVELPPIDARVIEQSVPAATHERPGAVHHPKPLPQVRPQQAPVTPQMNPRTEEKAAPQKEEVTTNKAVSLPAA